MDISGERRENCAYFQARWRTELYLAALLLQQTLLDFQSISIAAQGPVAAHHTVAGDQDGNMVCAIGAADGTDRFGLAYGGGNIGITAGFPFGYFAQFLPDRFLEDRALDIKRDIMRAVRRFDLCDDLREQFFESGSALL